MRKERLKIVAKRQYFLLLVTSGAAPRLEMRTLFLLPLFFFWLFTIPSQIFVPRVLNIIGIKCHVLYAPPFSSRSRIEIWELKIRTESSDLKSEAHRLTRICNKRPKNSQEFTKDSRRSYMKPLQFVMGKFGFGHAQNQKKKWPLGESIRIDFHKPQQWIFFCLENYKELRRIGPTIAIFTTNARFSCFAHENIQQRDWVLQSPQVRQTICLTCSELARSDGI